MAPHIVEISKNPNILLTKSVISPQDCAIMIERSKPLLKTSEIAFDAFSGIANFDIRRSQTRRIDSFDDMSSVEIEIIKSIQETLGIANFNCFPMHINRYGVGGVFKAHYDPLSADSEISGLTEDREMTCIIYLNNEYVGGETAFPVPMIGIKGDVGDALSFDNYKAGSIDLDSLHGGLPVESGEKWILVIWKWTNIADLSDVK